MASWGSAFITAFKIVLASILWVIIGIVLLMMGASIAGLTPLGLPLPKLKFEGTLLESPPLKPSLGPPSRLILGGLLMIAGYALIALGALASYLKYSAEYYAREVRREVMGRA